MLQLQLGRILLGKSRSIQRVNFTIFCVDDLLRICKHCPEVQAQVCRLEIRCTEEEKKNISEMELMIIKFTLGHLWIRCISNAYACRRPLPKLFIIVIRPIFVGLVSVWVNSLANRQRKEHGGLYVPHIPYFARCNRSSKWTYSKRTQEVCLANCSFSGPHNSPGASCIKWN